MPKQIRNRRGGFVKTNPKRKKLKSNDLIGREAPEGFFRVISIRNKEVWIEGTFSNFPEAKKVADDTAKDGISCYVHGNSPRVMYIARR